jgi:glycosyltransferase involved in cell wall biosynthesis
MTRRDRRLRVCVLEGHDFPAWEEEFLRGERPSRLPYGLERLSDAGLRLRHGNVTHSRSRLAQTLRSKDPQLPYRLRYNGALGQVLTSLPHLIGSDVCLSVFEHHAEIYARLRSLVPVRLPPMVLMSCYLSEWLLGDDPALCAIARRAARAADWITAYSANQVEVIAQGAGVPSSRVHVVPYGIDTHFYRPDAAARTGDFVVAVGRDQGRDWQTFLAAAALTPEVPYKLATPDAMVRDLDVPPNVDHLGEVEHTTYRRLLCEAAAVVVPTKDYAYPTGQSVMLEAMASGAPVIVPDTRAMRDYATDASRLYDVGSAPSLAGEVRQVWRDPILRRRMGARATEVARRRFDTANMWDEIIPLLCSAGGSPA